MSNLSGRGQLTGIMRSGSGMGETTDYNDLSNKPSINNVELSGNKSTSDLNISYNDLTNKPTIRNVPETTGAQIGSVLTHTENGEVWNPVPKELPSAASGNNGDVLTLVNGSPAWAAAGGSSDVEYSTSERAIGTWIDGKTLYQKTIYYRHTDTIAAGYTTIGTISNVDYIEFMGCSLYNPTDKRSYALPYAYSTSTTTLTYDNGDIKLRINNDNWNPNWDIVVTVRYTKVGE